MLKLVSWSQQEFSNSAVKMLNFTKFSKTWISTSYLSHYKNLNFSVSKSETGCLKGEWTPLWLRLWSVCGWKSLMFVFLFLWRVCGYNILMFTQALSWHWQRAQEMVTIHVIMYIWKPKVKLWSFWMACISFLLHLCVVWPACVSLHNYSMTKNFRWRSSLQEIKNELQVWISTQLW